MVRFRLVRQHNQLVLLIWSSPSGPTKPNLLTLLIVHLRSFLANLSVTSLDVLRHGAAMTDERAPGSLRRMAAVTWTGRAPPPAIMSGLIMAAEQLPAQPRKAKVEISDILAELRERPLKAIE